MAPPQSHETSAAPAEAVRLSRVVLDTPFAGRQTPIRLSVRPGEILGIIGRNGSGKSAFVRTVLGLQRPRAGRVRVAGVDMYYGAPRDIRDVRTRIGFVLPDGALLSALTVFDNVALHLRYHGSADEWQVRRRVEQWLTRLDLADVAGKRPAALNVNATRRVAIARALVHEPDLVVFDEPFAQLDEESSDATIAVIRELHARGATVIIASIGGARVSHLVDRYLRVENGSLREPRPGEPMPNTVHVRQTDVRRPFGSASQDDVALPQRP